MAVLLRPFAVLPPTVGAVFPGKPADGKLFPGDTIVSVDGDTVGSFQSLTPPSSRNRTAHGEPLTRLFS